MSLIKCLNPKLIAIIKQNNIQESAVPYKIRINYLKWKNALDIQAA